MLPRTGCCVNLARGKIVPLIHHSSADDCRSKFLRREFSRPRQMHQQKKGRVCVSPVITAHERTALAGRPHGGSPKYQPHADAHAFPRGVANVSGQRRGGCARGGAGKDGKGCRRRHRRRRRSICRGCRERRDGRGACRARGTSGLGDGIAHAVARRLGDVGLHGRGRTRGGRGPDRFARRGGERFCRTFREKRRRRGGARRGSPGHARRGGR